MKLPPLVHKAPAAMPAVNDAAPAALVTTPVEHAQPLRKAELGALTNAARGELVAPTRPKAPWWQASVAIAADALARGHGDLAKTVQAILERRELKGAHLSLLILDAAGTPVVDVGASTPRNPCSNAKVITAAWALATMGPAHRLETKILQAEDGSLVIRGGFDPTLTKDSLTEIARALAAKGITQVPRIVVDTGPLVGTNVPRSFASYQEQDWEYLSRPEPFSVDKNLLKLTVTPGAEGAPPIVVCDSSAYAVRVKAQTIAAQSEFSLKCDEIDPHGVLEREHGKIVLEVWGDIAADYAKGKTLTMKSPAPLEQSGAAVKDVFTANGITVGAVESGDAPGGELVHTHKSKALATILETSLATSNAFDHEMLALATAAFEQEGAPVSLAHTAAALTKFLHSLGADGELVNGSGIGNESRIPASVIAGVFHRARTDRALHSLLSSVSSPGGVGTLKTRMIDTAAEGVFHGKTGTGDDAIALSGVAGDLTMSVIVDDMKHKRDDTRAVLDALAIALSTFA